MKKEYLIILIIPLAFSFSAGCLGQSRGNALQNKISIDTILANEHLNELDGKPETFYSDGFQTRSKTLQKLLRSCISFYEEQFPGNEFNLRVYILNKADWNKPPFGVPYGMPFYTSRNRILVIAAEKNALRKLSGLPDEPLTPDSVLYGFDYQPLHELGHYFFFTLHELYKEKWLNEFLATYFMICYIKEKNIAPELEAEFKTDYHVSHRNLKDFENFYMDVGPSNYNWYQQKFAQLGYALYPRLKTGLIRAALKNYSPGGKNLNGVDLIRSLDPETINTWLKSMK